MNPDRERRERETHRVLLVERDARSPTIEQFIEK
jgi:hypothetical protein